MATSNVKIIIRPHLFVPRQVSKIVPKFGGVCLHIKKVKKVIKVQSQSGQDES